MLTNDELLASDIVANSVMNRERGLAGVNSYQRELHFDILDFLQIRADKRGHALWYDACCGEGKALREAAKSLERSSYRGRIEIVGVDLVEHFAPADLPNLRLIAGDVNTFAPEKPADLITCVHGLHYLGDKLGFIEHAHRLLAPGAVFLAHLDTDQLKFEEGEWAARLRAVRSKGVHILVTRHVLQILRTDAVLEFGARYLGATVSEKPNYTGIVAIDSWYAAN